MAKKTVVHKKKPVTSAASDKPQQAQPAGRVQLLGIRLSECASKIGQIRPDQLHGHAVQPMEMSVNISNENNKLLAFILKIRLDASYDEEQKKEPAISIAAQFIANYLIVEDFSDHETFCAFVQHVGLAITWPYWREFVQSITTRMGLPAFPIPLINSAELIK